MAFDWQQESKERYFQKAESMIRKAGFEDILQINRSVFAITQDGVRVYLNFILRTGNINRWREAKGMLKNLQEQSEVLGRGRRQYKSIFIRGYMVLEMEEQDR